MGSLPGRAGLRRDTVFKAFKYTIYALLLWNVFLFFQEDLAASAQTFGDSVTWRNVVEAYSATIDTAAWLILLLLFELETAVIDDARLKGNIKWLFTGVRGVSYFFITYAFYGYCYKYAVLNNLEAFAIADVCALVGSDFTWVSGLDEYLPLDTAACSALQGKDLVRVADTSIIATVPAMQQALHLAIVDIVNAADWLVIVVLLEIEVFLQIRERLTDRIIRTGRWIKALLYGTLFAAAIYWGLEGDFLDFWDAFLWLVAFIFIEMNIFQWQEETEAGHVMEAGGQYPNRRDRS